MSIESFGGGFDFGAGGELTSFAGDVSSVTLDSGSEFLSDGFLTDGLTVNLTDTFELQSQVGDFAGSADWFDANFAGDIVDAPGLSDYNFDLNTADISTGDFNFGSDLQVDSLVSGENAGVTFDSPFQVGPDSTFTGGVYTPETTGFDGPLTTGTTDVVPREAGIAAANESTYTPSFLDKLQGQANLAIDQITKVVQDPAFVKNILPKAIAVVTQPGGVTAGSALSAVSQAYQATANNPTPVAGTNTTANRNTLPTGENVVGPPSPFDPNSPEFNGPPAPPKATVDPAIVNAAISAITGVNVGAVVALKNSPTPVSASQVLSAVGGNNVLSAGGTLVAGAAVLDRAGTTNLTGDTSGYNNFTVNANAGTATAFAPAAVGSGDQLAGLTVSQVSNTTADPPAFKVDINGVGVLTKDAAVTTGLNEQARQQQTARVQTQNAPKTGDWRVRLSLADGSRFLYNAANAGERNQAAYATSILTPLWNTNGVIFPYTPSISTSYRANYTTYDLTHSNYRGYFYQNSYIDAINIRAKFTAQDTAEANYLLAVIHFFRTVTKMFYGQDAERGSPPPLTFLSGLGDFQFNMHPCVISSFEYELPDDVDYIRAQVTSNNGTNLLAARNRSTSSPASPGGALTASLIRMISAKLTPGAESGPVPLNTFGTASPDATYVPTKMNINLTLLPIQSRSQVSQLFSVKDFAAGNLLKGGFW
jgi:hypothetical protein